MRLTPPLCNAEVATIPGLVSDGDDTFLLEELTAAMR